MKMRRKSKKIAHPLYKQGDFVFAKMRGYRAWPARILQRVGQGYNVFFYGTCETGRLRQDKIFNYEKSKLRLGETRKLRHKEFRRAVMHSEIIVANPSRDGAYYRILSELEDNVVEEVDLALYEDSDEEEKEEEDEPPKRTSKRTK